MRSWRYRRRAQAHEFGGQYTKRTAGCASGQTPQHPEGKYACQAHYLLRDDDPVYGPLWKVRHTHGCTDKAVSGQHWTLNVLLFRSQGNIVWNANHSGHNHTTDWCFQSHPTHGNWNPEAFVVRGNNNFQVATNTYHCTSSCYWQGYEENVIWNVT